MRLSGAVGCVRSGAGRLDLCSVDSSWRITLIVHGDISMHPADWSKAVIARDQKCTQCGSTESLTARHLVAGDRYDPDNGEAVCMRCRWKSDARKKRPKVPSRPSPVTPQPKVQPKPMRHARPEKKAVAIPPIPPIPAAKAPATPKTGKVALPPRSLFKHA